MTPVLVTYNMKQIEVMVNDEEPTLNYTLLDLSEETAEYLGIKEEGVYNCIVLSPEEESVYFTKLGVAFTVFVILTVLFNFVIFTE